MKKFRVTYDARVVGLSKADEVVHAKSLKRAKAKAGRSVDDPEFVSEYLEPIIVAKVKKIEEVG